MTLKELAKIDLTPERLQVLTAAMAEYDALMKRGWADALPEVQAHLRSSKPWRELKSAAQRNEVEQLKTLLPKFLRELGLKLPEGVLRAPRGRAGRPPADDTELIYRTWERMNHPKPADLAQEVYGKDFTIAKGKDRKRMADRCAAATRRFRRNRTRIKSDKLRPT